MSATTTIQINGSIEFRFSVSNWELAKQIEQLLTKNAHSIVRPTAVSTKVNGNGHAQTVKRSPENKEHILQILKEKYGSSPFRLTQAIAFIQEKLGRGSSTTARALQFGKQEKRIVSEHGVYHFLVVLPSIPA